MKRGRRRLGTVLIALGVVALLYGAAIYFWRDPVTDLYARYKQHQLAGELERSFATYRDAASEPAGTPVEPAEAPVDGSSSPVEPAETEPPHEPVADETAVLEASHQAIERAAQRFFDELETGVPLGRIIIPKLDIDPVFVNGTRWGADLSRGPGRYPETFLPGMGRVTAIAGHRTTFGAPFRHIDRLEAGDEIVLDLPYGTFHYRVVEHEIVANDDWSIIEPREFETLVLSACHPLFSASQRWIVYARLSAVDTPDGRSYALDDEEHVIAAGAA
jgi:sortase A